MNIIDMNSLAARKKAPFLVPQLEVADDGVTKGSQKHQVKIDVKKILILQNRLSTTTI